MGNHEIINLALDMFEQHIPFYQKILFLGFCIISIFLIFQILFKYLFYKKKLRMVRKLNTAFFRPEFFQHRKLSLHEKSFF